MNDFILFGYEICCIEEKSFGGELSFFDVVKSISMYVMKKINQNSLNICIHKSFFATASLPVCEHLTSRKSRRKGKPIITERQRFRSHGVVDRWPAGEVIRMDHAKITVWIELF